jgi:hypothetical protein
MAMTRPFIAAAGLLVLCGCTTNRTTLIVIAPQAAPVPVDPACNLAPTATRVTPVGALLASQAMIFPPAAVQAGVRVGCAGVFFHLAPDGGVVDAQVAVESPLGFQFGHAALTALSHARYQSLPGDHNWHYVNATVRYNGPAFRQPALPGTMPQTANPFHT